MSQETPQSLHAAVRRQVAQRPGATAIRWRGRALSYGELWEASGRLARRLAEAGSTRGEIVALVLARSLDLVIGMVGVLRAGGAYLPIDPDDPAGRRRSLLEDAGCRLAVAEATTLLTSGCEVVDPGGQGPSSRSESGWSEPTVREDDLAYVLYTSGSTGRPKGVEVPHRGVLRLVFGSRYVPFGAERVFLHLAPPAFDAATFEVWGALAHGATLVVAPPGPLGLDEIGTLIEDGGVDTLWLTASLFNAVVDERPEILRPLRWLLVGGEALSVPHVREAARRFPGLRLINGYGPTEGTTFTCTGAVEGELAADAPDVAIGRPLAGTRVRLLDEALEPVAEGVVGELFIAGDGLARGYRGRPRDTAESFLPDPFARRPGERMYRSGDLARLDSEGRLHFVGRIDDQVKIRGFRVEPGEVRAVLRTHPEVRDAEVLAVPAGGALHLVAWVVPSDAVTGAVVREWLAERLAPALVPRDVHPISALPRGVTGKVDRRALLATLKTAPPTARGPVSSGAGERPGPARLADLWSELLGCRVEHPEDDFFRLGGHSLLAVRLAARLRSVWGREVEAADIFRHARLGELAAHLETSPRLSRDETEASGIGPAGAEPPLTAAQERVWFLQRLYPEDVAYHFTARLRLRGDLDVGALRAALAAVVRRHPVYRTVFPLGPDGPVQRVLPPWVPDLAVDPLAMTGEEEGERRVEELRRRLAARPFDLERLPLVRWHLVRRGPSDHELILVEHHLLHDGWSFQRLLGELARLYAARVEGRGEPPAPAAWSPADVARHERLLEAAGAWEEALGWWREHLAGLPAEPEPEPEGRGPSSAGLVGRRISARQARRLRAAARERGATLFSVFLAAFVATISEEEQVPELLVGTGFANRDREEVAETLGMLVNTVPLRVSVAGRPTLEELLDRVRAEIESVRPRASVPFDRLVRRLSPRRPSGRPPLVRKLFSFHDAPLPRLRWPGLEVEVRDVLGSPGAKFDLNVIAAPRREQRTRGTHAGPEPPEEIEIYWEYRSDLYSPETVTGLARRFEGVLASWLDRPDSRLPDLRSPGPALATGPSAIPLPSVSPTAAGGAAAAEEARILQRLLPVWRDLLDAPEAGPDAELFALGGHSLLAVRLAAALEREGLAIPLARLLEARTARGVARWLAGERSGAGDPGRVRLQEGCRPPLVLVHGIRGVAEIFRALAARLPGREVLALEAPEAGAGDSPGTMTALADRYLAALGPDAGAIHLAGFSFGGALAWEMARRAPAHGIEVLALVVLDHAVRDGTARRSPAAWLRALAVLPASLGDAALRRLAPSGPRPEEWPDSVRRRAERHLLLLENHQPGRWSGAATVIRSRWQPPLRPFHHDLGWGRWVDGVVTVRVTPGGHSAMLRVPVVGRVAGWVGGAMSEAEGGARPMPPR